MAALASLGLALALTADLACGTDSTDDAPPPLVVESGAPETSILDAADEPRVPHAHCTADVDCVAPNACYTAHCDLVLGACTYALCEAKGRACSAGHCDVAKSTCDAPQDYGLRTTRYEIGGATLGCPTSANDCFAAIYPFVFVGTTTDVVIVRADDLRATAFTAVNHGGSPVPPARIVASGRRLWILGAVQGTAPSYRLPLTWIDVPSDPTVASIAVQSTLVTWPFVDAVGFAAPDGGVFLSSGDAAQGFPTVRMNPPFPSTPTVAVANADAGPPSPKPTNPMYRVSAPPGSALVASSGSRLVLDRGAVVNLVTGAGTPSAQVDGDQALVPGFAAFSAPRFAQGPDGVVLLTAPIIADGPPPDCDCTTHEHLHWVLPNAVAKATDVNVAVDLEGYTSPRVGGGVCHQCNPNYVTLPSLATWLDAKTALLVAPSSGPPANQAVPAVRVVERDPIASAPNRRFVPAATETPAGNFASDRIALASSNGFGYLLVASGAGTDVHLSIFDPRCDVR